MKSQNGHFYEFGDFRLDAAEKILRRGDQIMPLSPKVFDTLLLLVEHHGQTISKPDLMEALWADAFVEESNLSQNIYTLRRVLGANFIETVPKRGYRFTAPVKTGKTGEKSSLLQPAFENIYAEAETISTGEGEKKKKVSARAVFFFSTLFLISVFSFLSWHFWFSGQDATSHKSSPVETVAFEKQTFTGDVSFPTLAPDGKLFAYVRGESLFVQEIGGEKATRINASDIKTFGFLQFSPDGGALCFRNQKNFSLAGNIFQVSRFGGAARLLAENVWSGFSFSPDGKKLAFLRFLPALQEYVLIVKNLETGEEKPLLRRKLPEEFLSGAYPAFSPDQTRIAVVFRNSKAPIWQIALVDTASGKFEILNPPRLVQVEQIAYFPDGESLAIVGRENDKFFQLWRFDLKTNQLRRLTNDLNIYRGISLSADGKRILARQHSIYSHIWTAEATDAANAKQITFGNQNRDGIQGMVWLGEDSLIYSARVTGDWDIYYLRPADGFRTRLTENAGDFNINPAVSPDGKYIFFTSTRGGSAHIWRIDAATGENPLQITFGEKETEHFPAVSPDGRWLYYLKRAGTNSAVWRLSLSEDGKDEPLTPSGQISPAGFLALSPDAKWLAFHNLKEKNNDEEIESRMSQIGIVSTESSPANEIRFVDVRLSRFVWRWTADSKSFEFIENTADGANIVRRRLEGKTPPEIVVQVADDYLFNFRRSPNGSRIAFARGRILNDAVLLTGY